MLKKVLVGELIDDGKALLAELDRTGFPVSAAFWVDLPDSEYWRLVLASHLVDIYGPMDAYKKVQRALVSMKLGATRPSGLSLDDISVFSPNDQDYLALRQVAAGPGRLGMGPAHGRAPRKVFEDAHIYRL